MRAKQQATLVSLLIVAVLSIPLAACKRSDSPAAVASAGLPKKWEFPLGARGDGGLALTDDGNVIAASEDGYIYSIDANGTLVWKTYIGATHASPLIGPDGAIYIANDNGSVFALNRSGSQRWRSIVYRGNTLGHNAAAIGNAFLFTPSRDGLKAVSLSDGRIEWSTDLGTEQWGAVTLLSDGTVLYGGHGRFRAVNTHGDELWQYPQLSEEALRRNGNFPPPGDFFACSSIAPGPGGALLVGAGRKQLVALGQDGALRWKYESQGNNLATSGPVVSSDGTIYFGHPDGHLYAFDSSGAKKWDTEVGVSIASTPVLASDGTIFIAANRYLQAVSREGKILARTDVGNMVTPPLTIASDGTVYVLNDSGILSAYAGGHGGLMDSLWPKFQGDLANSGVEHAH